LFDDIGTEAGALVHAENPGHAANDATDHASNNRSNRTSRPFTISRTPLDATGDALSVGSNGKQHRGNNSSGSDKTADHDNSFDVGLGKNTSTQRAIGSHRLKRTDVTCVQNRLGRQPRISRH
jgi:hypothetical protein